jgi:hypothetical protein
MYSTCLFCHTDLGTNEVVEHFPVGRRLAFDAAKGRLWVVCRKCERWNLTPLEERWEAIEECERSYRSTKLRTSTEQIGLGRLSEGLELVRIGKPLRPEFAAWRYGDQFGARRRRNIIQLTAAFAAGVAIPAAGAGLTIALGGIWGIYSATNFASSLYTRGGVVARVPGPDGRLLKIRAADVARTAMLPPNGSAPWGLRISHRNNQADEVPWWSYAKERDTAQLLPRLNSQGASARVVKKAIALAVENHDPLGAFSDAAHLAVRKSSLMDFGKVGLISRMPADMRLALEMISHEDAERRALEGELHLLEEAWKEAEEIAAISDDMFLPDEITKRLTEMKAR